MAAYDAHGRMLNADVGMGASGTAAAALGHAPPKSYRAELQLEVPLHAAWIRIAVRDANTNRIGAMEIKLPLATQKETRS